MSSPFSRKPEEGKAIKEEAKADSAENSNTFYTAFPMRSLFEHFMNKNVRSVSGKHSQETESARIGDGSPESPKIPSSATIKVENTPPKQIGVVKHVKMEEADDARSASLAETHGQNTPENPASHSLAVHNAGNSQDEHNGTINKLLSSHNESQEQHQNPDDDSTTKSPLSNSEEQKKHILRPDSSVQTEEADGKTGHKRSSDKTRKRKRKRKHSRKKSKSRRHSKRSKLSENITAEDESGEDKVDVSSIRAIIPKDLSVRHEAAQKEEFRDGKRRFKSKRFNKIMLSDLAPHQVRVTSWMVKREKDASRRACGGIIAYEMGLGKSVMSLACIAAHRLKKKDRKTSSQATLVVVPSSTLATQWLREAEVREEIAGAWS